MQIEALEGNLLDDLAVAELLALSMEAVYNQFLFDMPEEEMVEVYFPEAPGGRIRMPKSAVPQAIQSAIRAKDELDLDQMEEVMTKVRDSVSQKLDVGEFFVAESPFVVEKIKEQDEGLQEFFLEAAKKLEALEGTGVDQRALQAALFDLACLRNEGARVGMSSILHYLGLTTTPHNVHMHDICGGSGDLAIMLAFLRKDSRFRVSSVVWDKDPERVKVSRLFKEVVPSEFHGFGVDGRDVERVRFKNKKKAETYWVARHPDTLIDHIMTRFTRVNSKTMPVAAAVVPCVCHSYLPSQYPTNGDEGVMSREEWGSVGAELKKAKWFIQASSITTFDFEPEQWKKMIQISAVGRDVADAFRVHTLNAHAKHCGAHIQRFAHSDRGIIIQPNWV